MMAEAAVIKRNNNHAAHAAGQIRAGRFDAAAAQQQPPFLRQLLSCCEVMSVECRTVYSVPMKLSQVET